MTQLSEHFTFEELTFSQIALRTGMANDPSANYLIMANLKRLCETLLEPARMILAVPVHIDSGYRSTSINRLVGGASNSAHIDGRAADIVPIGIPVPDAFHILRAHSDLPCDQIILEAGAWVHLAIAPEGQEPRREALLAQGGPGRWTYQVLA